VADEPLLDVQIHDRPGYTVVRISGEIDSYTVPTVRECFGLLADERRLVVDLSGVAFIDSAGVGALVGGVRRVREQGGDAALACGRSSIARVLRTIGLDQVVYLAGSIGEAAANLGVSHDDAYLARLENPA
jgi:anti-sigma B factor antagonist